MPSVALDLTPVVTSLLDHPFDQPSLDRAYAAVGGHPQAYATALRCAAKKTPDTLAAAYWFAEAARVHESMDDLGGAIALLWRALECDRSNPRPKELLAAAMARLSIRAGLGLTFTPGVPNLTAAPGESGRPAPLETGIRPPAPERRARDTLPDLFGIDTPEAVSENRPARNTETSAASVRGSSAPLTLPSPSSDDTEGPAADVPSSRGGFRVEQLLPPKNPRGAEPRTVPPGRAARGEPMLQAIADDAISSRKNAVELELVSSDEVYAEREAPPTVRPGGARLVGGLFEALHSLNFVDDVREGAAFLGRTLAEKMRAATTLVHLYDINSAHFLIVSAHGMRAAALLDYATPEDDPFIATVMNTDDATLVEAPEADGRLGRGRWLLAPPKRSVLCAPVTSEGRYLGLLELADPIDGGTFSVDDRNALAYAASALGRFLDRRGLVLSEGAEI